MVPKYQVVTAWFSCKPPDLNSAQANPSAVKAVKLPFKIIEFDINSANQNPAAPMSTSNHHIIFTSILPLSEGREGEALESFNKIMIFLPPHNKVSLNSLTTFLFSPYPLLFRLLCSSASSSVMSRSNAARWVASEVAGRVMGLLSAPLYRSDCKSNKGRRV
jgi:hypothetical protein